MLGRVRFRCAESVFVLVGFNNHVSYGSDWVAKRFEERDRISYRTTELPATQRLETRLNLFKSNERSLNWNGHGHFVWFCFVNACLNDDTQGRVIVRFVSTWERKKRGCVCLYVCVYCWNCFLFVLQLMQLKEIKCTLLNASSIIYLFCI